MLSSLPNLTPRDSYTLWYTPSHQPNAATANSRDTTITGPHGLAPNAPDGAANNGLAGANRRIPAAALQRSPLARLRADEQYMERRKANVKNYGNSWLKPPGVMKTLFQLQEEKREMEEHEEAMRRERLVQELAEAEAEAAGGGGGNGGIPGEEGELGDPDDELGMEARDLDDDIPDADAGGGLGLDDISDDSDDEEDEDEDESVPVQRVPEQAYREALSRQLDGTLSDADEDIAPQARDMIRSQIITEDDVVHWSRMTPDERGVMTAHHESLEDGQDYEESLGMDADMEADLDLDDDIPDGELGEYEHTDTDASLDSSEPESDDGQEPRSTSRHPHDSSARRRSVRSSIVRSDEINQALSSSVMGGSAFETSSPVMRGNRRF